MPPWHLHADVWALVLALTVGYRYATTRWLPAGQTHPRRLNLPFAAGVVALWFGADWPVHDLSEDYLLSVHMTQHLVFTLVAPPLLLVGTPAWLLRRVLGPLLPLVASLARPLLAGLMFNALVVFTHWPVVVDAALRSEPLHFLLHAALMGSAFLMWLPVFSTLPEIRRLSDPGRMVYLFLQSVVPTVPASFLTFAERPLYDFYAAAPRIWGVSAVADQQFAGAIMKLGGGTLLWGTIVVIFFRWYHREQRDHVADVLTWSQVERELTRTSAPQEP